MTQIDVGVYVAAAGSFEHSFGRELRHPLHTVATREHQLVESSFLQGLRKGEEACGILFRTIGAERFFGKVHGGGIFILRIQVKRHVRLFAFYQHGGVCMADAERSNDESLLSVQFLQVMDQPYAAGCLSGNQERLLARNAVSSKWLSLLNKGINHDCTVIDSVCKIKNKSTIKEENG